MGLVRCVCPSCGAVFPLSMEGEFCSQGCVGEVIVRASVPGAGLVESPEQEWANEMREDSRGEES